MHFLDLIMYFVCAGLLWWILGIISGGDLTEEIGSIVGMFIMLIFTVTYIVLFALVPDWNWVDFDYQDTRHYDYDNECWEGESSEVETQDII